MNPRNLSVSDRVIWGIVLHLIADWPLQNDWVAQNKGSLRHPSGYIHAGIHGGLLSTVFGWASIPLAVTHLLIDTRKPVIWWSKLIGQTQPGGESYDIGAEVRIWNDQVLHIIGVAITALLSHKEAE